MICGKSSFLCIFSGRPSWVLNSNLDSSNVKTGGNFLNHLCKAKKILSWWSIKSHKQWKYQILNNSTVSKFTSRPDVTLWSESTDSISFSTMAPSRHSSRLLKPLTCRGYWPNCSMLHKVLPKHSHIDVSDWEQNSYGLLPWQRHIQNSYPRVFFLSQRYHKKAGPWGFVVCLLLYWK